LFVEYCGIKTVGITGTRGKSTTTLMTHAILKSGFPGTVYLGGNLAHQPLLPLLEQIDDTSSSIAVLELSSWQLQTFATKKISVNHACVTNLFPDHLNYYNSLEEYYSDKQNIFKFQKPSDHVCLLTTQPEFQEWANTALGQVHWFNESALPSAVKLKIPGVHNRLNAAAAFTLASTLGIPESVSINSLNSFEGVPYRLQTVRVKDGITFINDTTATTPVAASVALNTCAPPLIVISCCSKDQAQYDSSIY
jgi:UDP-N-acetylmuramoylalanine--D-glutamate ligase